MIFFLDNMFLLTYHNIKNIKCIVFNFFTQCLVTLIYIDAHIHHVYVNSVIILQTFKPGLC